MPDHPGLPITGPPARVDITADVLPDPAALQPAVRSGSEHAVSPRGPVEPVVAACILVLIPLQ